MKIHGQIGDFDCVVHLIRHCIVVKAFLKWICLSFEPCKLDGGGRMEGSLVEVEGRKPWHFCMHGIN